MPATKTTKTMTARTKPGPAKQLVVARSSRGGNAKHGTMKELDAFLNDRTAKIDALRGDVRRTGQRAGSSAASMRTAELARQIGVLQEQIGTLQSTAGTQPGLATT
jgi:hypothetical protein